MFSSVSMIYMYKKTVICLLVVTLTLHVFSMSSSSTKTGRRMHKIRKLVLKKTQSLLIYQMWSTGRLSLSHLLRYRQYYTCSKIMWYVHWAYRLLLCIPLPDQQSRSRPVQTWTEDPILFGGVAVDWWWTTATTLSQSDIQRSQVTRLLPHAILPPACW